jgi:hypothetical protein
MLTPKVRVQNPPSLLFDLAKEDLLLVLGDVTLYRSLARNPFLTRLISLIPLPILCLLPFINLVRE